MPLPAEILGRYRVVERIASGALGTVVAAIDDRSGREVAVKLFDGGDDEHASWVDELRLAARLRHPHIAACLDAGEDPASGRKVLVFDRARGGSLRRALVRGCVFDEAAVAGLLEELGDALALAHRQRVIHRDIKPENILCMESLGRPPWALTDFGCGRFLARGATARSFAGSRHYMAPEVLLREAGAAADLFSLGMVGVELLIGVMPTWEVRARFHVEERGRPGIRGVIARLVDADPERRFVDADALLRALRRRPIVAPPQTRLSDRSRLTIEGGQVLELAEGGPPRALGRVGRARAFINLDGERRAMIVGERRLVIADGDGLTTVLADDRPVEVLAASLDLRAAWLREGDEVVLHGLPLAGRRARGGLPAMVLGAIARAPRTLGAVLGPEVALLAWPGESIAALARAVDGRLKVDVYGLGAPLYALERVGREVVARVGDHQRARLLTFDQEGPRELARVALGVDAVAAVAGEEGPSLRPLVPTFAALDPGDDTQPPLAQGARR
ncbi:MAG: serine/threonine protein kinase [Myxococcales bacterium]|nr:serine/threonine protein kinase [Myxococcales bacterium]MCB9703755.1 serine/threonine protein kinase [Myxococcales bacterium]